MIPVPAGAVKNTRNVAALINEDMVKDMSTDKPKKINTYRKQMTDSDRSTVPGFRVSAVSAGLKKGNALDMALIYSKRDAVVAGAFTSNLIKAAPVIVSREHISDNRARAIIVNSGNANACTGEAGINDCRDTARMTANLLGVSPNDILVASTGVIGQPMDMKCVANAIPRLVSELSEEAIPLAARAIMTTDSFPKIACFEGRADGKRYRITGIAKGAGMIMPDMATMLCFIVTDLSVNADQLEEAVSGAVNDTFNRITVDGDTSTNDTVLVMANGMAGNSMLTGTEQEEFSGAIKEIMATLARMIVKDGEGATKLVEIHLKGALSKSDASRAARTIANSNLVKTAFYGRDPNWGRIMAVLGRSNVKIREQDVDIFVDDVQIVSGGMGCGTAAEIRAAERMSEDEFTLTVNLNQGVFQDRILTCDLTHEYVTINADYRT